MLLKRLKFIALFIFLIIVSKSIAQLPLYYPYQTTYVGIRSDDFNFVASSQKKSMWCWAASIEMVLRYHGLDLKQEDIVTRTFGTDWMGNPPPFGASIDMITENLNHSGIDSTGQNYTVSAEITYGTIPDDYFIAELELEEPLIIAYGPNIHSGHVVVLTAVSYVWTPYGKRTSTLVVRDPYPYSYPYSFPKKDKGRFEYLNYGPPPLGLPNPVQAVWFIDVTIHE